MTFSTLPRITAKAVHALFIMTIFLLPGLALAQEGEVDYSEMSLEDLLNVEVTTAGKKAQKINEIPASVVVITRTEIERQGYKTLEEILNNVTGLYSVNVGNPTGRKFGVRGFWSATANSVILLINGMRQERVAADGAVYMENRIPPEAIDRIEVVRGPMSVIYGSGAFFGVINVITNGSESKESIVSGTYGTQDTTAVFARTSFESGEAKTVLNVGYRRTEGMDIPYSRMSTYDLSTDYGIPETTKGRYGERNTFFNLSTKMNNFYADVNYDYNNMGGDVFFPGSTHPKAHRAYTVLAFGYAKTVSDKFSYDAKVTYNHANTNTFWDWFTAPGEQDFSGDRNFREGMEIDLTGFFNPSDKVSITAGLYYKKIFHEQLETIAPLLDTVFRLGLSEPATSEAAFVQGEFSVSEKFQLVAGVRGDKAEKYSTYYRLFGPDTETRRGEYSADDVEVLPRFAAIFKVSDTNVFKFLYGKAINHPNIPQNAAQANSGGDSLEPEFIETFELNHIWAGSGKISTSVSVFQNTLDKLIINDLQTDANGNFIYFNRNAGKIETTGVELGIRAMPTDSLSLEVSGTWTDSKDKSENFSEFDVPYSPEILGYLKLNYKINDNVGWSLTGHYVAEMESLYDLPNEQRLGPTADSYMLFDTSLRVDKLFGGKYYLQLTGNNLADEEYRSPTIPLQVTWADLGMAGDERTFQLTIGKKFGE